MKFEKKNNDKTQKNIIYLDKTGLSWINVCNDEFGTTYDINHFDILDIILLFVSIFMLFICILVISL